MATLSRKRSINIEEILNALSMDDLKTVCGGMELDDSGRRKSDLVDRLTGERTLSSIRDSLLPKLLSGELRVPDAEKMVEKLDL